MATKLLLIKLSASGIADKKSLFNLFFIKAQMELKLAIIMHLNLHTKVLCMYLKILLRTQYELERKKENKIEDV